SSACLERTTGLRPAPSSRAWAIRSATAMAAFSEVPQPVTTIGRLSSAATRIRLATRAAGSAAEKVGDTRAGSTAIISSISQGGPWRRSGGEAAVGSWSMRLIRMIRGHSARLIHSYPTDVGNLGTRQAAVTQAVHNAAV